MLFYVAYIEYNKNVSVKIHRGENVSVFQMQKNLQRSMKIQVNLQKELVYYYGNIFSVVEKDGKFIDFEKNILCLIKIQNYIQNKFLKRRKDSFLIS